jgi:hypothetical protein
MSRKQTTIIPGEGAFTDDEFRARNAENGVVRDNGVVHRSADEAARIKPSDITAAQKLARATGDWSDYNNLMARAADGPHTHEAGPTAEHINSGHLHLRDGESKTTYIGAAQDFADQGRVEAFEEKCNTLINGLENTARRITLGDVKRHQLANLGHQFEDIEIMAGSLGMPDNHPELVRLREWFYDVMANGQFSLKR